MEVCCLAEEPMTAGRRKAKKTEPSWAVKAVSGLTDAEVAHWCRRLVVGVPRDTRTAAERLVDEACGKKGGGK